MQTIAGKMVLGLTLSFIILGLAACGTPSMPVAEDTHVVKMVAPTAETERIEPTKDQVGQSSDLTIVDEEGSTSIDAEALEAMLSMPLSTGLTEIEAEGLIFMREEEKLARDVYLTLYNQWNLSVFQNIASSEQTHTDAVKTLLDQYGLDDPMITDEIGVFTNPDLQAFYDQLVARGSQSMGEALIAGAAIEEIDIRDLEGFIVQTNNANGIREFDEGLPEPFALFCFYPSETRGDDLSTPIPVSRYLSSHCRIRYGDRWQWPIKGEPHSLLLLGTPQTRHVY